MTATPAEPHALVPDTDVLTRAADELATRFVGTFCTETVERYVFESYTALRRTAKIRIHLVPPPTGSPHWHEPKEQS
jgi:arsenate reductase